MALNMLDTGVGGGVCAWAVWARVSSCPCVENITLEWNAWTFASHTNPKVLTMGHGPQSRVCGGNFHYGPFLGTVEDVSHVLLAGDNTVGEQSSLWSAQMARAILSPAGFRLTPTWQSGEGLRGRTVLLCVEQLLLRLSLRL